MAKSISSCSFSKTKRLDKRLQNLIQLNFVRCRTMNFHNIQRKLVAWNVKFLRTIASWCLWILTYTLSHSFYIFGCTVRACSYLGASTISWTLTINMSIPGTFHLSLGLNCFAFSSNSFCFRNKFPINRNVILTQIDLLGSMEIMYQFCYRIEWQKYCQIQ